MSKFAHYSNHCGTVPSKTGPRDLAIYHPNAQPPVVDPNIVVDPVVARREADAVADAQDRTIANEGIGRYQISSKRAERDLFQCKLLYLLQLDFYKR